MNSNRLPSIGVKRKGQGAPAVDIIAGSKLINERLNKQQNKVEQEIRKYDEILKRNKNLRQHYDPKKKVNHSKLVSNSENAHHNNSSILDQQASGPALGKDLIKIFGVKLDNRSLDARRAHHGRAPHDKAARIPHLPSLPKNSSQQKGLMAAKYSRLQ